MHVLLLEASTCVCLKLYADSKNWKPTLKLKLKEIAHDSVFTFV